MRIYFALTHIAYVFGDTGNHDSRGGEVGETCRLGEKSGRETFHGLPFCDL